MVERQKEAHREPEKGKQKGEGKSRNKDSHKGSCLTSTPTILYQPTFLFLFPDVLYQFLFQHNVEKGNPFCFLGGFRTKLQVSIKDVWNKNDD